MVLFGPWFSWRDGRGGRDAICGKAWMCAFRFDGELVCWRYDGGWGNGRDGLGWVIYIFEVMM